MRGFTLLLPPLAALLGSGAVVAQLPLHTFAGSQPGELSGSAVAWAGDVDDDGFGDIVVGSPDDNTAGLAAGRVVIYSGRDGSVLRAVLGDGPGDHLGAAVSGAGDVDGDGCDDVVVGAWGDDNNGTDSGSARVLSGTSGAVLHLFDGDGPMDRFGWSVGAAGDVDEDGYDDVIVGAPLDDNNGLDSGMARVFSGVDGQVLHSFDGDGAGDQLGFSVDGAGDVDGDRADDLVVGAPFDDNSAADAGSVRALSGKTGGVLHSFDGDAAGDNLGFAVAGAGDANGDGRADVVAGAPNDDTSAADAGMIRLFSGLTGSALWTEYGRSAQDALGTSVAGPGDTDGDGCADVIVGVPGNDRAGAEAGAARVFSGKTGSLLYERLGSSPGDAFGTAVGGGRIDADGFADQIVGAPGDDDGGAEAGVAFVFGQQPFASLVEKITHAPAPAGSSFGHAVGGVGDIDRDGTPDYLVGAPFDAAQFGAARLYSGASHNVLHTFSGPSLGSWFGHCFANVGDIDGDTWPDLGIGAWHDSIGAFTYSGLIRLYAGQGYAPIHSFFGGERAHMGASMCGLGDVDGDTVDDVLLGLGHNNAKRGAVQIVSGSTKAIIQQLDGVTPGDLFGWSSAPLGDLDGDGITDFVVGVPQRAIMPIAGFGYARVFSGADRSVLFTVNGPHAESWFAVTVDAAGDVDGDGKIDIVVGAPKYDPSKFILNVGLVQVFSGAGGGEIHRIEGAAFGDELGTNVRGAGDVNGDGYADFIAGAATASPGGRFQAGQAILFSGWDGSVLQTFDGDVVLDKLGTSVSGIGDINADGYGDVVVGAPLSDLAAIDAGLARVFTTAVVSDPGTVRSYGAGCPGSSGALPRIGSVGSPRLGRTFSITLRAARPVTAAAFLLGGAPQAIDLGVIQMPGCTALTLPLVVQLRPTDSGGKASLPLPVPSTPRLTGQSLFGQWAIVDAGSTPLGVVVSDGAGIIFGGL